MCGLCGIYNFNNKPDINLVLNMMSNMKNRGPDDEGYFQDDQIALGFVRLSIIDLSDAGHQPMVSDDGRYIIVQNGEIYNYIELREELKSYGINFRTRTDTEVLLKSYIYWGEECLNRFNGMWAFVIYDTKTKSVFGARDRFGIKPLYYYIDKNCFIFASDINSIFKIKKESIDIDNQSIYDYLVFNRTDLSEDTFFTQIKKIPHSSLFHLSKEGFYIKRWYFLKERVSYKNIESSTFLELLKDAVKLRLRSDVSVGVCLSGGLDSSSIVSILIKFFSMSNLNTFSAVYGKGEPGDESPYINLYKYALPNMFSTTPTAESLYNDADSFIYAMGEPVPSTSPYAQYKVMELAKDYVVVTLDGQGADEQLAGYDYFFGYLFKELIYNFKLYRLFIELYYYLKNHKSLLGFQSSLYFMLPGFIQAKLRNNALGYVNKDLQGTYMKTNRVTDNLYKANTLQNALMNHFEYKLEHLLKWEDRNSMNFSLEARVPYLDYRLVEYNLSSYSNMIINKGSTKYILREAMRKILPEEIRTRNDKVGFETPQDKWFRTQKWQSRINDIISSSNLTPYIYKNIATKLYNDHLQGNRNIAKEIWKWINLDRWLESATCEKRK